MSALSWQSSSTVGNLREKGTAASRFSLLVIIRTQQLTIPYSQSPYNQTSATSTVTVTYDATPIPTPSNLPALVTGTFSLPSMPNRVSSTCFNDTTLSQAWACNIVLFAPMVMNIDQGSPDRGGYSVTVTSNLTLTLTNNVYSYGEQPFYMPDPLPMELVNDTYQPARGPAWFRMLPFNKTVILPEASLTASPSSSTPTQVAARSHIDDFMRKGIAQPGDKPWVCTWPETFFEIFIYPEQNSSWNNAASGSSSSWPSGTATSGSTSASHGGNSCVYASSGYPPASTTSDAGPSATTPYVPAETSSWVLPPPLYPRVLKLEERRIHQSPQPYCRQMEISHDGQPARPVKDANGDDVVIYIAETEPAPPGVAARSQSRAGYNNGLAYRDSSELSDCGCTWFNT